MIKKIVFFYGPKYNFKRRLPRNRALTTISELAIYSDRKMREHTFKIQSKHSGDAAEKQEERLVSPASSPTRSSTPPSARARCILF